MLFSIPVILKQCFIVVIKNVDSGPRLGFKIVSMSQVMDLGKVLIVKLTFLWVFNL